MFYCDIRIFCHNLVIHLSCFQLQMFAIGERYLPRKVFNDHAFNSLKIRYILFGWHISWQTFLLGGKLIWNFIIYFYSTHFSTHFFFILVRSPSSCYSRGLQKVALSNVEIKLKHIFRSWINSHDTEDQLKQLGEGSRGWLKQEMSEPNAHFWWLGRCLVRATNVGELPFSFFCNHGFQTFEPTFLLDCLERLALWYIPDENHRLLLFLGISDDQIFSLEFQQHIVMSLYRPSGVKWWDKQ